MHKKVVTTQAREGIETCPITKSICFYEVTTQAREGIETAFYANLGEGFWKGGADAFLDLN